MVAKSHLKMAAFDMDGTITGVRSSWEYLHRRLGIWEGQAQKYQELYLAGDISYEEFCRLDAAMWRNMSLAQVYSILDEIPLDGNAQKVLDLVVESGAHPVLLSTGLKLLADRLAGSLGFKTRLANELVHREGKLTGEIIIHVSTHPPGKTKGDYLRECMRLAGASPRETMAVGDSAGDLDMLQEAGLAIAVNPSEKDLDILQSQVKGLVTVCSLGEVLEIIRTYYF